MVWAEKCFSIHSRQNGKAAFLFLVKLRHVEIFVVPLINNHTNTKAHSIERCFIKYPAEMTVAVSA